MEQAQGQSNPNDTPVTSSGPWAWYVLLVTGVALTGFFPWLMVSYALYQRGKRLTAMSLLFVNLALLVLSGWILLRSPVAWWWVVSLTYLFNGIWALAAWLFQKKTIGSAPRRYLLTEWKSWITPVIIGVILGVCITIIFSIIPAVRNRTAMWRAGESLDREVILWDFFTYTFLGLSYGLVLGFWWAGERNRFRASSIITFLAALSLTIILWSLFGFLLIFLVHKGTLIETPTFASSNWAVVPPWVSGFRQLLLHIHAFDMLALLIVSLLFGAASRIRDFGKRSLLIPLTFLCILPRAFSENEWWQAIQDQIFYEMASPDRQTRASAYQWAEMLLKRYPEHLQWPNIAEDVTRYYYQAGEYEKSRALYQDISDHYGDSNRWYWTVRRARAALNNPEFGNPSGEPKIEIPIVDYENYLTPNWMALLSVIRYWEGPQIPESEVKIKLKDLSLSDDKISLSPLANLADLDDAAQSLGYEVLILPANLPGVKALIAAGIPIIHQNYTTFSLIFGFDESRTALRTYIFDKLSYRVQEEARKEAEEILAMKEEGQGESQERLARIANEAYSEYSADFWNTPVLRYIGPFMALVFPTQKADTIAAALNTSIEVLTKRSNGYLATLIGLSYLNHADPIHAIEWAKIGAEHLDDPILLYGAYMAKMFWESRNQQVNSKLRLQDQFPELAQIFTYFNEAENIAFLERARLRFEADLDVTPIPWMILDRYVHTLDQSDPVELDRITTVLQQGLSLNPAYSCYWSFLAETYEWAEDIPKMVEALKGAISANPLDSKMKLRLAYGDVLLGHYADAKVTLEQIDVSQIKYDADYPFCLGAVAEWEGDTKDALRKYAIAVEMRRYKPIYFLKYGKLLQKEGLNEKARQALEWAARIDAKGEIKQEAENLLAKM
jgi:hypothetical protein